MRRRVLLIDLDPQGNATAGCGIDKNAIELGSCEVLLGECTAAAAIRLSGRSRAATPASLAVLPTNQDLTAGRGAAVDGGRTARAAAAQRARSRFATTIDLILIDCPPALNMLAVNALVAADSVLIPMQCEYYALEGLSALRRDHRADPRHRQPAARHRRYPAHDVRSAKQSRQRSQRAADHAFRRPACFAPSCRAMCGWPRRRASARARWPTIRIRAARWPIWPWPGR